MSVNWRLARSRVTDAVKQGMVEAGRALEAEAASRAPIDQGDLRANTSVTQGERDVHVTFHQGYAAVQHENESFNHPRGGEAKYLEGAARDLETKLAQTIANHAKGMIR